MNKEKLLKYSVQLELYKHILSTSYKYPIKIGGIIRLYKKAKIYQTIECSHIVKEILENRKHEIHK